jgi:hypothetical protein
MQPSMTVTGNVLKKVLVVDPTTGAITAYNPGQQPSWIDRIMSQDTVSSLINTWGRFNNAGMINFGGAGEMTMAGTPSVVYNMQDVPVWMVPMTSSNGNENSATGIMVYSTTAQKGTFYPGIHGFGVGSKVQSDFETVQANGLQHYPVDTVQLYDIFGVPTWVAVYDNNTGGFAAIGFMDARRSLVQNVIYAPNEQSGLAQYQNWLAENPYIAGGASSSGGTISPVVTGTILRIGPTTIDSQAGYEIIVAKDFRIYTAFALLNTSLPVMKPGDKISFTYRETSGPVEAMQSITDLTLTAQMAGQ